jgi:hypothetical protein
VNARGVGYALAGLVVLPTLLASTPVAAAVAGPVPGTVFIQTVPALAGVHLLVGSSPVTTGAGGVAKLTVADFNSVASKVSLASTVLDARDTVALANVNVAPHTVKYESHLTVGLNVTSKVTLQISGGNTGVSPGDVHAIRLHSVTGATILVDPQATPAVSLLSRQTRMIAGTITAQVVTWSIDSLLANPGVSVTTSGHPFDPLTGATWPLVLLPVAGTVIVDTVPATPGVSFGLEGATGTTDAQGHVTMPVTDLNGVGAGLNLSPSQALGSTVSVLRVAGLPSATAFQRHLVAALAVSLPISLGFTDSDGHSISPSRISDVKITGGGATVDISGAQLLSPVSVLSEQGKLANGSWQPQQVTYTVTRVTVDGSDAVFAGQQRFNPNTSSHWSISLSAFDLTVTVRDVLFGRRIASSAEVTRPDGKQYGVLLDAGQPTVLRSLVRGQYTLLTRSAVLGANSKILVSKNSDAEIRVVTLSDILVFAIVVLGASASVVVLGVSMSRRSKRRRIGASDE